MFLLFPFWLVLIIPGGYARAAAPAAIPATLSLKEATGVCSGSATAFNVNSTSFESSKLKFYREMLDGVHEKNNASTKQNAPKATAAEDWFSVAYMLHQKRRTQSSTSNYNSRMEAMRYVTIAEYNNTNKISNNEYKNVYNWCIHRSGLNYSSSLSSANTDIRKSCMTIIWHNILVAVIKKAGIQDLKVPRIVFLLLRILQTAMFSGLF